MFTYSNGYWEVYRRYQGDFFGLGVEFRGGGYMGGSFLGGIFHGGREIQWKGAGFSSITIKKKQWKYKYEKVFSIESKEKH